MIEAGVLVDASPAPGGAAGSTVSEVHRNTTGQGRRAVLTRSGLEFFGIEHPAKWLDRHVVPLLASLPGRAVIVIVVVAGVMSLASGRPHSPTVSSHPVADALLGLALGLGTACLHELAHAVALVHYGRRPRRAGFGFYWGGIAFYVDSTEALTLPRNARVIQALVGVGVDVVAVCILAIVAQLATPVLIVATCWRIAIIGIVDIVTNLLPILHLDGHWALADYLDEPELASRARAAFGSTLRGQTRSAGPRWLAIYGAVSFFGGLALLVGGALVWWSVASDLIRALFSGSIGEIIVGIILIGPFAASTVLSALGLILEVADRTE
jgi:putative peptide zinc metalloprotease protein